MNLVSYIHLRKGDQLPELTVEPRKVVLIAEEAVGDTWQADVIGWLVRSGCLYFVTWGESCEAWHDAMDDHNANDFEGGVIPVDRLVMTTWHADEPLSKAMWFAAACAVHPIVALKSILLVHVASQERKDALIRLSRSATALDD